MFGVSEPPLWDTSGDPVDSPDSPDPVDLVPERGLGPSLPHAPGARMTVISLKQTPSNKEMCNLCFPNRIFETISKRISTVFTPFYINRDFLQLDDAKPILCKLRKHDSLRIL